MFFIPSVINNQLPNGLRRGLALRAAALGTGVDSVWEQRKLEATLSEMLGAKRPGSLP
jgi:hypothetical protein